LQTVHRFDGIGIERATITHNLRVSILFFCDAAYKGKEMTGHEPTLQYVLPSDPNEQTRKSHATTGASAAGVRAVSVQFMAFYFRTPIKAFFRSRVE